MSEGLHDNHERRIAALEALLPSAVLDLIHGDPHQWSDRPCPTCGSISKMIGRPFGCYWYQQRLRATKPREKN